MTSDEAPLAIVCGGGSLPFAVADAVQKRGRRAVLIPIHGWTDPKRVQAYTHHWIGLGQFGAACRHARSEGCRDMVFIGTLSRPRLSRLRFDLGTLRALPRIIAAYRGGDNHLLSGIAAAFEAQGFHLIGPHEVAPEILVPEGVFGRRAPGEIDRADIERGLGLIKAMGPYDVGQGVVVAGNHVLAVEAAEGTDRLLARVAELPNRGRSGGVLIKAPKPGQDWRFDLPSIGPQTVEGAAHAGLNGIAVLAGGTIMAEPQRVAALADERNLFVVGLRKPGPAE